jgi:hypothetical protein
MREPTAGKLSKPYEYFCRIKEILAGCRIWDWGCEYPPMPIGTIEEMLQGKTEPIGHKNRIFHFQFEATLLDKKEKEAMKQRMRSFPQYFAWVE